MIKSRNYRLILFQKDASFNQKIHGHFYGHPKYGHNEDIIAKEAWASTAGGK